MKENERKIQNNGKELIYCTKPYGPGTYKELENQIRNDGYVPATANHIFSIFQNSIEKVEPKTKTRHEKGSEFLYSALENSGIWGYTGSLFIPDEGLYIQDNPKVEDNELIMDRTNLIEKLNMNDSSLRFVPAHILFPKRSWRLSDTSYSGNFWNSNYFFHSYPSKTKTWSGISEFEMDTTLESCGSMSASGWHTSKSYYKEYEYWFSPNGKLENSLWKRLVFVPRAKKRCAIGIKKD